MFFYLNFPFFKKKKKFFELLPHNLISVLNILILTNRISLMQKSISSSGNSSHTDIFTKSNGHKIVFVHFQRATRGFICMSMLASACFYKKSHISHIFPILLINLISLHKYVHVDICLIPFSLFLNESWLSLPLPSLTWRPLKTWKLSCASLTLFKVVDIEVWNQTCFQVEEQQHSWPL